MEDENTLLLLVALLIGGFALYSFIQRQQQAQAQAAQVPATLAAAERVWQQIQEPLPSPIPPIPAGQPTNACGATLFEMPDFSGTPREGQGCIDDLDCYNHSVYSRCCRDGTCY